MTSRHRSRRVVALEDARSLLDAIAAGDLDDRLGAIAAAVEARRRLVLTVRSATALAALCVGDVVRITEQISPRYLAGLHGTVVGLDDRAATVQLEHRVGRFASGHVRCPPLTLEKLPTVESALAGRNPRALGDRLDAGVDPQALGLFGVLADEPGELCAHEGEAVVELRLAGVGAASDAHRPVDARLRLRPRVPGVDLASQLRPAAGKAVEGAPLLLDAAVRGD